MKRQTDTYWRLVSGDVSVKLRGWDIAITVCEEARKVDVQLDMAHARILAAALNVAADEAQRHEEASRSGRA